MTFAYAMFTAGAMFLYSAITNTSIKNLILGLPKGDIQSPDILAGNGSSTTSDASTGGSAVTGGNGMAPAGKLQELFNEGTHIHVASCNRDMLIQLAKIGQSRFGLSIREFPPFDHVDCVHVSGSFHYRQSGQCNTPRNCSNRGDGLAFDASGAKQLAFHSWLKKHYGSPS